MADQQFEPQSSGSGYIFRRNPPAIRKQYLGLPPRSDCCREDNHRPGSGPFCTCRSLSRIFILSLLGVTPGNLHHYQISAAGISAHSLIAFCCPLKRMVLFLFAFFGCFCSGSCSCRQSSSRAVVWIARIDLDGRPPLARVYHANETVSTRSSIIPARSLMPATCRRLIRLWSLRQPTRRSWSVKGLSCFRKSRTALAASCAPWSTRCQTAWKGTSSETW